MKIGITGASGFVGGYLIRRLRERGHSSIAFSREAKRRVDGCVQTRVLRADSLLDLHELDGIVNLAGESIQGLWTPAKKKRIRSSRVKLTQTLVGALSGTGVRVLVSASATGIYGDRGEEVLPESAPRGTGFLADVCAEWETAALAAEEHGVRVALPRFGFIVAPHGGAMEKLRPLFRLGLGGELGSGRQWMPWVHIDDICGLIIHLLEREDLSGVFNATAPNPVTNATFTRLLAETLHRPAFFRVPALALRMTLGELSSLALDSTRVMPAAALNNGYTFRHEQITNSLG